MASGKVIAFGNADMEDLARIWPVDRDEIVVLRTGDQAPQAPLEVWLPRFKSLSAQMLRNYLASPQHTWGVLALDKVPSAGTARLLFDLLRRTYRWIAIPLPMELQPAHEALIEAADSVVWLKNKATDVPDASFLGQLTRLHFPHAFVHEVKRVDLRSLPAKFDKHPELWRTDAENIQAQEAVEQVKASIQPELMKAVSLDTALMMEKAKETVEAHLALDANLPSSTAERERILERVLQDVLGFGPLDPFLKDADVDEIMVNGSKIVYVEKKGRLVAANVSFPSEKSLRTLIDRIVSPLGRRVDESMPLCDARLPDGSRVNVVLPPLALDGPVLTIRKFSAKGLGMAELERLGAMNHEMVDFLIHAVRSRKNIIVSGGTGSGKTTLLNALSGAIPDDERIVTIEDAAELRLQKPHVVRLESRPPNAEGSGAIPIRRLVINALRMRPDRIIVGECRGGEALDMLQAMNTGHDGSMTTLHANSPRDALGRLETLVLMAGIELPVRVVREQIRSAVHLIVQLSRCANGSRKVTSITEVTGMEGDVLSTRERFAL